MSKRNSLFRMLAASALTLLFSTAGARLCAASSPPASAVEELPECCRPKVALKPQVIVASFVAQGCEASAHVKTVVAAAREDFTSAPVLFVSFDFSTPEGGKQAEYLAAAMGLEDVWAKFARQTGFIVVAEAATGKALAKITRFENLPRLKQAVEQALQRAVAPPALVPPIHSREHLSASGQTSQL